MTEKRGGVYCRISLKDPNIPKVEQQEAMCRKLAEAHGVEVVAVYVDDGVGASELTKGKKKRDDWIRLLDDVQAGNLDVILAQAEDRFSRQPMEKEFLDDLCAGRGVTYLTQQDGTTDPAQASGRLGSGIKALVARYYVASAAEKHRSSNAASAMRGEPQRGGVRPFGYGVQTGTRQVKRDQQVVTVPIWDKNQICSSEAKLLREAFADLISGARTLSRIRTEWNNAGVLTTRGGLWDIAKVEALLRRPRNAGIVVYQGKALADVSPAWEPIVTEDTYRAAMAILDNPKRRLSKVHEAKHLCSSLARCGACGSPLRSTSNARARTYRCAVHEGVKAPDASGQHVSISTHVLDEVVRDAVVSAVLFAPTDATPDPDSKALAALHVELGEVRKAEARLLELVEAEVFSVAEVAAKRATLREQAEEAERRMAEIAHRNARAALLVDAQRSLWSGTKASLPEAVEAKQQIRAKFDGLPLDQQRALIKGMLVVTVMRGRGPERVKVRHLVATSLNEEDAA